MSPFLRLPSQIVVPVLERRDDDLNIYSPLIQFSLHALCGLLPSSVIVKTEVHAVDVLTSELLQHRPNTRSAAGNVAVGLPVGVVQ